MKLSARVAAPVVSQAVLMVSVVRFAGDDAIIDARASGGETCGRVASHCMRLVQEGFDPRIKDRTLGRGFLVLTELTRGTFTISVLGPHSAAREVLDQLADRASDVIEGREPLVVHPLTAAGETH